MRLRNTIPSSEPTKSQQLTYFCNGANFLISSQTFFASFRKILTTFYAKNIRFLLNIKKFPAVEPGWGWSDDDSLIITGKWE